MASLPWGPPRPPDPNDWRTSSSRRRRRPRAARRRPQRIGTSFDFFFGLARRRRSCRFFQRLTWSFPVLPVREQAGCRAVEADCRKNRRVFASCEDDEPTTCRVAVTSVRLGWLSASGRVLLCETRRVQRTGPGLHKRSHYDFENGRLDFTLLRLSLSRLLTLAIVVGLLTLCVGFDVEAIETEAVLRQRARSVSCCDSSHWRTAGSSAWTLALSPPFSTATRSRRIRDAPD